MDNSNNWISVEDRLPTIQDADDRGYVMTFLRKDRQWGWPTRKGFNKWSRVTKQSHTHWMKVLNPPEPPKNQTHE